MQNTKFQGDFGPKVIQRSKEVRWNQSKVPPPCRARACAYNHRDTVPSEAKNRVSHTVPLPHTAFSGESSPVRSVVRGGRGKPTPTGRPAGVTLQRAVCVTSGQSWVCTCADTRLPQPQCGGPGLASPRLASPSALFEAVLFMLPAQG